VHKRFALTISVVLLLTTIACSKHPNDDQIQKDIQTKAAADPDTRDSPITVEAKDGKVTLTGKVATPAAQQKLEQIAKEEPGTTGVDDQTAVDPQAMASAPVASQPMAAQPEAAQPPPPAPVEKPKPQPVVVPAGTALTIKLGQALGSKSSQTGQTFLATLAQPVTVKGRTAMPAGSTASGTVVSAKSKGKIKGEGELVLSLTSITLRGKTYTIQTATLDSTVKGKGKRTAVATGGGAAGGALIGGIAGGGKGAGIGALVGAGAGLVGGTLTGNKQIEYPAESALTFTLSAPLTLPPASE
jgi:hypothetical protein